MALPPQASASPRRAWLPSGVSATWGQGDLSTAVPLPSSHAPSMDEQCRGRAGPRGPDEPSEKPLWAQGSLSCSSRAREVQTSRLAGDWLRGYRWRQPRWEGNPWTGLPPVQGASPSAHLPPYGASTATEGLWSWSRCRKGRGVRRRVSGAPGSQAGVGMAGVCR